MSDQENENVPSATEKKAIESKHSKASHYKSRLPYTVCLGLSFTALGLAVGQSGPTFLDLQLITNTDIEKASAFFTAGSVGYLTGSFISGAIYNMMNKNLLMFGSTFGLGIASFATPYCEFYGLMIFIRFLSQCFCGLIDTSGNSEHMRIWGSEGEVLLQLLHFTFAFGGVISPLYTEPFLAERGNETVQDKDFARKSDIEYQIKADISNTSQIVSTEEDLNRETNVHYAFLITAVASVIMSLPFLALFAREKISKKVPKIKPKDERSQRKLPLPVFLFIMIMLSAFYVLYTCVEDTFAAFLMTFLVREYDYISKSEGAYITAIYWASFAISRFLMIFVARLLTSVQILTLLCGLMFVAFTSFVISATFGSQTALSVFSAMAGLGMSAIFPAGISWTERELLPVTGRISSCIFVSASFGTMINPLILGYLMDEFSNMWFCYLLVGETTMTCCMFVVLFCFNRCYVSKHYGPLQPPTIEITIELDEEDSHQNLRPDATDDEQLKT